MKISSMKIRIEPTEGETVEAVTLVRENKLWSIENRPGLFPNEIALATALMKVIQDYNGGKI